MISRKYRSEASQSKKNILTKEYPYKKYFLNIKYLINEAKQYKLYNPSDKLKTKAVKFLKLKKYKDDYMIFFTDFDSDKSVINYITDYYTEECRLDCRRESQELSPIELYKNKKYILYEEAKEKLGNVNFQNFNEFLSKKIVHCSNHKLTYLLGILDFFKPKRWLDMSAGWGDRLISAGISGVERYLGVDPNPCMQSLYKEMINDLIPLNKRNNYEVLLGQAEKIKLPKEKFDFIFTSPPFFTFEIYNEKGENKELQSTFNYTTIKEWLEKFLFKMINNAWPRLEKGGNFILYIEDNKKYSFIPEMLLYFNKKKNCVYDGIIYQIPYKNNKQSPFFVYRTIYCWHKI